MESNHFESESDIIEGCILGNPRMQRMLYEKFSPKMYALCIRYAGNTDDAQDILQDGFVKVFTKLKDFKNAGSLEGWIRRVMVNTALDQIRKNGKTLGGVSVDDVQYKIENNDHIAEQLMAEDLLKLINSMPDGYKVVFNMFAIEGYTHNEIADTLGISESTSKSQYSRARAYLRERISEADGR
jgi:RNA polymerase sigma-70 factor (ECF subfamily)